MTDILHGAMEQLDPDLAEVLRSRATKWLPQVNDALGALYPGDDDVMRRSLGLVADTMAARPTDLARLDRHREINPDWFQHERMVGYVAYVDRFADDLSGVAKRIGYLAELKVTYLHLMPFLESRPEPNDGGFAVTDYTKVDPALGTMSDLADLATDLRAAGISLCADVVLNHTAAEHHWADRAREGDERHLAFYRTYPDRTEPDRWETTLPEVFPETAPGNFTWDVDLGRWVWTTFNPWQWDLDWSNPDVFVEMLAVMLNLAQHGVEVMRLDAIPFVWKQMGTRCQNLPEVHLLLQGIRGLIGLAAPAVILKGEAIVAPADLVPYQGVGDRMRHECDLLYHNQLMVQSWSGLAAQDGELGTRALASMAPTPPHASWVTYVRCHDDIGWAIDDATAADRGWDGAGHRAFLSRFYAGELEYSPALGAHFQEDFVSGDRRTSGTAAALTGIQRARAEGDEVALGLGIKRLLLLHALAASYTGLPLIYAGDELGLGNVEDYLMDPDRALDNRWMHRPRMDWSTAELRYRAGSVEGRVFSGIQKVLSLRSGLPTLRAGGTVTPMRQDNPAVLAFRRTHPWTGQFLGLANFSESVQTVDPAQVGFGDLHDPRDEMDDGRRPVWRLGRIVVPALGMCWLTEPSMPAHQVTAAR